MLIGSTVAEAHELTMQALEPTFFQKFVHFGYIHTQRTGMMMLFTMPSDYKYAKKEDAIQRLVVQQPKNKQLYIASCFRANNNPHCFIDQIGLFRECPEPLWARVKSEYKFRQCPGEHTGFRSWLGPHVFPLGSKLS